MKTILTQFVRLPISNAKTSVKIISSLGIDALAPPKIDTYGKIFLLRGPKYAVFTFMH